MILVAQHLPNLYLESIEDRAAFGESLCCGAQCYPDIPSRLLSVFPMQKRVWMCLCENPSRTDKDPESLCLICILGSGRRAQSSCLSLDLGFFVLLATPQQEGHQASISESFGPPAKHMGEVSGSTAKPASTFTSMFPGLSVR